MESLLTSWLEKDWDNSQYVLPLSFYERNTVQVAKDLLGKLLVIRLPVRGRQESNITVSRIVETEAYCQDDPASHSSRGRTDRNSIMFGPPGVVYIYFIYGMYEMLNFVTEPEGCPGAVLIRAVEPLWGESFMQLRRPGVPRHRLTHGPGCLTRALGIRMSHRGESLRGPIFYVVDEGKQIKAISVSPRVGISQGQDLFWRFFLTENSFVSRVPQNAQAILV